MMRSSRAVVVACLGACLASALIAYSESAAAEFDPWAKHAQWFSLRGGYAKSTGEGAADGNAGFGFGYTRFWNSRWASSAFGHFELLGSYQAASEIEVPWTLELTRHVKWNSSFRPYLGLGAGAFYHQFYRTGQDVASVRGGGYLVGGGNVPIGGRSLLGLDVRVIHEAKESLENGIFGVASQPGATPEVQNGTQFSVKLNYSWVY